jgi:hypothetical protein
MTDRLYRVVDRNGDPIRRSPSSHDNKQNVYTNETSAKRICTRWNNMRYYLAPCRVQVVDPSWQDLT